MREWGQGVICSLLWERESQRGEIRETGLSGGERRQKMNCKANERQGADTGYSCG